MKAANVLPFVALSAAIVVPTEQVFSELSIEDHHHSESNSWYSKVNSAKEHILSEVEEIFDESSKSVKNAWSRVSESAQNAYEQVSKNYEAVEAEIEAEIKHTSDAFSEWIESAGSLSSLGEHEGPPPHHGPPPHDGEPHHPKPPCHRRPHHPKHPHEHNLTVYQLIAGSEHTTIFLKLINDYPDIVATLNSTKANVTVFAPTNKAFEKIPEKAPKPSKEQLLSILQYHILPEAYPALRVLHTHTAPTLLIGKHLGSGADLQRLTFRLGLRGLTVNWQSRIIAVNIFGSNGVIHGVDSIILPPPPALKIIEFLPGEFSTLELGLAKTGLLEKLNTTDHNGGTLFAPSNWAFKKLGPRINAFLFSDHGAKYLKALLEYHVVPDHTLYSDAYYKADSSEVDDQEVGHFHVDLPTLLEDRTLSVDVGRLGGFITIKINAFTTVSLQDIVAQDGVIHIPRNVIIPPKTIGGVQQAWEGEELTVEDLKERLQPFVRSKHDL
jgi:uncharacterized surface protein with fasciclin (FAS1) repeats